MRVKLGQARALTASAYKVRLPAEELVNVAGFTTLPPVAAVYQTNVSPIPTVAVAVNVCGEPFKQAD